MNARERGMPQRQPGRGNGEAQVYRLKLDPITLRHLDEITAWFEGKNLSYSQSAVVRASIRDYLMHLQTTPDSLEDIVRKVDAARGVTTGRRGTK